MIRFKDISISKLCVLYICFFILSILNIYESKATVIPLYKKPQSVCSTDSNIVKIIYKNNSRRVRHTLTIYINNIAFKSYSRTGDYLYLPDSLSGNDKIKIIVFPNKYIRRKVYNFNYSEKENVEVLIIRKKDSFFKRKKISGTPVHFL